MSDSGAGDGDDRGPPSAAEYVLGVLSAHERRAVEQRITREPAFAREVAFWEERLGGLAEGIPPVRVSSGVWTRIEAALDRGSRVTARSALWQSLAFWRGLALGASALAAACLAALFYLPQPPTLRPPLVAKLDETSGKSGFFAAANPADGSLTIVPAALLTGQEHTPWSFGSSPRAASRIRSA